MFNIPGREKLSDSLMRLSYLTVALTRLAIQDGRYPDSLQEVHRWLVQNRPEDSLAQDAIYDPLASPSAELEQRREFAYFPTGIRMPTYIWAPKDRSGRQWNLYRWRNGYSTSIETELCRVASSDRPLIAQVPEIRLRVITDQATGDPRRSISG